MSRSGYSDYCDDNWATIRWRGAVKRAIEGHRGQEFLKEMLYAFDALSEKRLIADSLQEEDGEVCALGAVGKFRGINMTELDPEYPEQLASTFGIAPALVREVMYENDEYGGSSAEDRFHRMREWVRSHIAGG